MIKGQPHKDLVLAYHAETDAILFVSQLPDDLRTRFDTCIDVGRFLWQGEPLHLSAIERRPLPPSSQKDALVALKTERTTHV